MRVLIAVDGSLASDAALQEVASRPWPKGSEFSLVTAVDPFFFVRAPLLLEEAKKSTKEELEEDAESLRPKGWPVNTGVLLENPRHAIPKMATEWKADLIVLGIARARGLHTTADRQHSAGGAAPRAMLGGNCAHAPRRECEPRSARHADLDTNRWIGVRTAGGEASVGKALAGGRKIQGASLPGVSGDDWGISVLRTRTAGGAGAGRGGPGEGSGGGVRPNSARQRV